MKSAKWTLLGFAINRLILFGNVAILARILAPGDFGMLALSSAITGAILLFADLGLSASLITEQDAEGRKIGAVFFIYLCLGPLLGLVTALTGGALVVCGQTQLGELLLGFAVIFVVSGASWFYMPWARRQMQFRRQFFAQSLQALTSAASSVAAAMAGIGVWSFLAGQAVGTVVLTLVLACGDGRPPRPSVELRLCRDALSEGKPFFAQGALGFVAQNSDNLAVGIVLGSGPLGYYSMAYRLAEIPYVAIANPICQVLFTRLSQDRAKGRDPLPTFADATTVIALAAAPVATFLAAASGPVLTLLYGSRWTAAAGALTLLGLWGVIRPIQVTVAWLLNSQRYAGLMAKIAAITLIVSVPVLILAAETSGIRGVALTMLIDMAVSFGALLETACRRLGVSRVAFFRLIRGPILACLGEAVAVKLVTSSSVQTLGNQAVILCALLAGTGAYFAALFTFDKKQTSRSIGLMIGAIYSAPVGKHRTRRPIGARELRSGSGV